MAVFCDFENVALGVRDANYEKFDIKPVLERLLLKGSIVVKKSYCDWDRYKGFKATMHEANFELIEIPHVRQSGKNSADIRLVVDALDLCYTKSHVNTFVIISGDSDFSPLVSKLRENNKQVIGVGVKQSTSDLLVANCDEFIFYDDLVREVKRAAAKRDERKAQPSAQNQSSRRSPDGRAPSDESNKRKEELETRKAQAIEMVVEMFDALVSERGDSGKIWASLLKDTLKRRRPEFNETYFGFRTFGNLLEEAQARGMLEFGRDEKSGAYVYRSSGGNGSGSSVTPARMHEQQSELEAPVEVNGDGEEGAVSPEMAALLNPVTQDAPAEAAPARPARGDSPRGRGRGRGRTDFRAPVVAADEVEEVAAPAPVEVAAVNEPGETEEWTEDSPFPTPEAVATPAPAPEKRRTPRAPARKTAAARKAKPAAEAPHVEAPPVEAPAPEAAAAPDEAAAKPARKTPARSRRPAKAKAGAETA